VTTEPQPPTLAEVVRRAVEICDPAGESPDLERLLARFEDRDEPITAVEDLDAELSEARGAIDPEGDEPAFVMALAVILYLAHRRDEVADERDDILRLAARAEFDGSPPANVAGWLAAEGIAA
jgi:hypothetical protein